MVKTCLAHIRGIFCTRYIILPLCRPCPICPDVFICSNLFLLVDLFEPAYFSNRCRVSYLCQMLIISFRCLLFNSNRCSNWPTCCCRVVSLFVLRVLILPDVIHQPLLDDRFVRENVVINAILNLLLNLCQMAFVCFCQMSYLYLASFVSDILLCLMSSTYTICHVELCQTTYFCQTSFVCLYQMSYLT